MKIVEKMNQLPPSVLDALEKAQRVDQRASDMRRERSKRRHPRRDEDEGASNSGGAFEDVRSFLSSSNSHGGASRRSATSKAVPTVTR